MTALIRQVGLRWKMPLLKLGHCYMKLGMLLAMIMVEKGEEGEEEVLVLQAATLHRHLKGDDRLCLAEEALCRQICPKSDM